MILTTLAKLKQRVNAPSLGDVDARCGALLEAATFHVAAYLRTDFDNVVGEVDTFSLRRSDYRARTDVLRLELSNNLVSAITCKVASSRHNMKRGINADVDVLDYEVDETNGLVLLPEWKADNQVVEVTYTKGLTTTLTDGFELADNVPFWLEEAALVTAAYHYILPSIESTDELCDGLPCEAKQLLDPYKRGRQDSYQAG